MTKFTIIKNSESNTGYKIDDKTFKGIIHGLCCGWQYEFLTEDGKIVYGDVTWTEETPEQYAYRWFDNGLSWLESGFKYERRFTGRVIFRGYAEEYWDEEEHETFVREVEV